MSARFRRAVLGLIDRGASLKASPAQLVSLFAATVIIRNLLETASLGIIFEAPAFIFHFPSAYYFPMLGLVAMLHLFSGYNLGKLLKIMILAWTLTLLPPLIDFVIGSENTNIGYFPLQRENALWFLVNFFNPAVTLPGTTAGIRVEAFIGCVLAGVFSWSTARNRRLVRGIGTTLVFMPIFLMFFTRPHLVRFAVERFFPVQENTQRFIQWRSATEIPLHGSAHFTIFLVDMIPVTLLAGWMLSRLAPDQMRLVRRKTPEILAGTIAALAGAVAAFSGIPGGGLTFADVTVISGAFMAFLWVMAGGALEGCYKVAALTFSLLIAWACGWNVLLGAMLTAALLHLPGPGWLSRGLACPVAALGAMSSAGLPGITPGLAVVVAAAALTGTLHRRRRAFAVPGLLMVLSAALMPPRYPGGGRLQGLLRQTDSFYRSGMSTHGHASAMKVAARGGGFRTLAEGAHLIGLHNRGEWAYEVGTALGDSSVEMLKVGVNLASVMGDSTMLWNRAVNYMNASGEAGAQAAEVLLGFAASRGDTTFLRSAHSGAGLSDRLLVLYSRAHMALGDTTAAVSCSRAALSYPSANQSAWEHALGLAGITGGNYDSLYSLSRARFGFSIGIALARLRAGMAAPGADDREILHRCLLLNPEDTGVLETAALWHLAADEPDSAMGFALRAMASQTVPTPGSISLAVRAARAAGREDIAGSCLRYARSLRP